MAENGSMQQTIANELFEKPTNSYSPSLDIPEFDYQGTRLKKFICFCGDCFLFKSCFDDHLNRRSVKITCIKSKGTLKTNYVNDN